ncbi:hypothetical protein Tco_0418912 [Tanacetum coccineum]
MSATDNFSLHDDEELSLHDDASLDGSPKPKPSSSKNKPSQSTRNYSFLYTSSSRQHQLTATPGLADEVIHSFLATNADDVDLIHEDHSN